MENPEIKKEDAEEEKKLSKRDFILVIIVILFLSGATFWNFKSWRKSLGQVELPKFEMPKMELFPEKGGSKEWTSPDGKLKMKYPADWIEVDIKMLENYVQREVEEKPLLVAQKFSIEKSTLVFLTVNKLNFEESVEFEEILEKMKEDAKKREGKMEVLNSEIKDKEMVFEAKYTKKGGTVFLSREKILLEKGGYLVSVFAFEKDWSEFKKEAEEIINSVQLVE